MGRNRADRPQGAKPLRLFVAVDVPEDVKTALAGAIAPFRDPVPARWTNPNGWHLTLKFLGTTWPRVVDGVREAVSVAAQAADPFVSSLTEVGAFPSANRARVLWAGLADAEARFARLAEALDGALAEHFMVEQRAFVPHLTLARLSPARDVREFAPGLIGMAVPSRPFAVERLVLYRSHLSPRGATYEPLLDAPLGTGVPGRGR